jgi:hypothetical protein
MTETMSHDPAKEVDFAENSRLIRRGIRTETNGRFLRRLPMFKTDDDVPDEMQEILDRLEQAERARLG